MFVSEAREFETCGIPRSMESLRFPVGRIELSTSSGKVWAALFTLHCAKALESRVAAATQWRKPSSYTTMIGGRSVREGTMLLYSLALVDPWASVYVAGSKGGRQWLEACNRTRLLHLKVYWQDVLDKYDLRLSRKKMVSGKIWGKFQMEKALSMSVALNSEVDTLFLDADSFVLGPVILPERAMTKDLGLSPHFIQKAFEAKNGKYNGGLLWTKTKLVPPAWIKATKRSRYFDQAALEELASMFQTFTFGREVNLGWWQLCQREIRNNSLGLEEQFEQDFDVDDEGYLRIDGERLSTVHTHLLSQTNSCPRFNEVILRLMARAPALTQQLELLEWAKGGSLHSTVSPLECRPIIIPPFTVIVLSMNRYTSLLALLKSLSTSLYDEDTIDLIIHVDHAPNNDKVIAVARSYTWRFGKKTVEIAAEAKGLARAWLTAWKPVTELARAIILEDDTLVSNYWYKWLKAAWGAYHSCESLAGISLQRQTLVPKKPRRQWEIVNKHKPFLYPLVGSIGFSPNARHWRTFQEWALGNSSSAMHPATPDLVTYDWWIKGARKHMWTQHFVYFCRVHKLYTLYTNLPQKQTIAAHTRAKGQHFHKTMGQDFEIAAEVSLVFPNSLSVFDWNATYLTQISCSTSSAEDALHRGDENTNSC